MISLFTICYEGDWRFLLRDDSWFIKYESDLIKEKLIIINNVINKEELLKKLTKYPKIRFVFSDQYKEVAKSLFQVGISENDMGYWYAIGYYVAFICVNQPYFICCAPDVTPQFEDDYLLDSIKELKKDKVIITTLPWFGDLGTVEETASIPFLGEPMEKYPLFRHGVLNSDNFWFSSLEKMKKVNFNVEIPENKSLRGGNWPGYAGKIAVEKVLSDYFHFTNTCRAIYQKYRFDVTHKDEVIKYI